VGVGKCLTVLHESCETMRRQRKGSFGKSYACSGLREDTFDAKQSSENTSLISFAIILNWLWNLMADNMVKQLNMMLSARETSTHTDLKYCDFGILKCLKVLKELLIASDMLCGLQRHSPTLT
jgi:hypothetical protein